MKKQLLTLILATLLPLWMQAQEIIVKNFEDITVQNAIQSTGDWPMTNEGEPASKIIVQVQYKDQLTFGGRVLTYANTQQPMVQHLGSEYTVFMAPRSQSITIKIPGFNDKRIDVRQYLKNGLQPRGLYRLRLTVIPKSVVAGRNFSWGISGGYLMPMIDHSANGVTASPINYNPTNPGTEGAAYKEAQGFVAGINADIRLRKNWYLNVGVNYGQYTYTNEFEGQIEGKHMAMLTAADGSTPAYAHYKEAYKHSFIEVPIYASLRFPVSRRSNLQVGVGPVVGYQLSADMDYNGEVFFEDGGYSTQMGILTYLQQKGSIDLFGKNVNGTRYNYYGIDCTPVTTQVPMKAAPLNRFNVAAGAYLAYEWHGVSLSVHYRYMFTNMANSNFWDSNRASLHDAPEGAMKGYKLLHNALQFKLGYTLRY